MTHDNQAVDPLTGAVSTLSLTMPITEIPKKHYWIVLQGCDDHTTIEMDLTETEHTFLQALSDQSQKISDYGCQPALLIFTYSPEFLYK